MVTWQEPDHRKASTLSNPAEWRFSPKLRLVVFSVVVNLLTTSQLGYMSAIWNHPRIIIENFFNSSHFEHYGTPLNEFALAACYSVSTSAALISCLPFGILASWLLDKFGRKTTCVYVCATVSSLSSVIIVVSKYINSYELFFIGRFIYGLAEAIQYSGVTLYITECSPPQHRGLTGAMMAPSMGIGLIVGTTMSHPAIFGNDDLWPWLVGFTIAPNLLLMAIGPFLPDSPKFAFITLGKEAQAKGVIRQFSGANMRELDDVIETYRKEEALAEDARMKTILECSHLRFGVLLSTVAVIGETCEGWIITDYYSASLFRSVGVNEHYIIYAILGCQTLTVIGCVIVMLTVDKVGRRPYVIYGLLLSFICVTAMMALGAFQYHTEPTQWVSYCVLGAFALMSFVNTPATTVVPILRSELVPQNVRSTNCAISTVVNAIFALTLCIVFPIVLEAVGPYSLLMFLVPLSFATIYMFIKLPETKGRTVDQIVTGLRKTSISGREFLSIASTVRKISVASVTGREIITDDNCAERERMLQLVANSIARQEEKKKSLEGEEMQTLTSPSSVDRPVFE